MTIELVRHIAAILLPFVFIMVVMSSRKYNTIGNPINDTLAYIYIMVCIVLIVFIVSGNQFSYMATAKYGVLFNFLFIVSGMIPPGAKFLIDNYPYEIGDKRFNTMQIMYTIFGTIILCLISVMEFILPLAS